MTPCPQCGAPAERVDIAAAIGPNKQSSWRFDLHAAIRERLTLGAFFALRDALANQDTWRENVLAVLCGPPEEKQT